MKSRVDRQIDQVRRQLQRAEDEVRMDAARKLQARLRKLETEKRLGAVR